MQVAFGCNVVAVMGYVQVKSIEERKLYWQRVANQPHYSREEVWERVQAALEVKRAEKRVRLAAGEQNAPL